MNGEKNSPAQRLMEAFTQFKRLKMHEGNIMGLKPSELRVLFCIKKMTIPDSAGLKVSEISRRLNVTSSSITQVINSLEGDNFVERAMDAGDRRAVRVRLTAKGELIVHKANEAFFASFEGLVNHLGEEKSNQLTELLTESFAFLINDVQKHGEWR